MPDHGTRFWTPVVLGIAITPILLFLAMLSTGAGHGNYVFAQLLYPYTMLSFLIFGTITMPCVGIAIIQYTLYGVLIAIGLKSSKPLRAAFMIAMVHVIAVVLCFATLGKYIR